MNKNVAVTFFALSLSLLQLQNLNPLEHIQQLWKSISYSENVDKQSVTQHSLDLLLPF